MKKAFLTTLFIGQPSGDIHKGFLSIDVLDVHLMSHFSQMGSLPINNM